MVLSCIGTTNFLELCPIPRFLHIAFQLENIHHHHSLEEAYYFPAMEEKLGKGALSANIEEHEEFVPKLEALDEWCKKVQKGEVVYDGEVFTGMVEAFAGTMVTHMTHVRSIFLLFISLLYTRCNPLDQSLRNSEPWTVISFEKSLP